MPRTWGSGWRGRSRSSSSGRCSSSRGSVSSLSASDPTAPGEERTQGEPAAETGAESTLEAPGGVTGEVSEGGLAEAAERVAQAAGAVAEAAGVVESAESEDVRARREAAAARRRRRRRRRRQL